MADKVYSIEIDAPIRRVWEQITGTGVVQMHMFACVLDSNKPGTKYLWHSKNGKYVHVKGQIVESSPPTGSGAGATARFVQTFKFTMLPDDYSLVEWELTETTAGRTRVKVMHSKLDPSGKTIKSIDGGWPSILKNLKALCEKGRVPFGTRMQLAMMGAMSFMLPKSTLAVNNRD